MRRARLRGLDVSVQAQVIELLHAFRQRDGLPLLFVTHNLALVPSVSDRMTMMQSGRIVEQLPSSGLRQAVHPHTKALLEGRAQPFWDVNRSPPTGFRWVDSRRAIADPLAPAVSCALASCSAARYAR
ncbi:MAG: hypothetical protein ACRDTT_08110 [Pseudonocardiaceae bacterium]